MSNVPVLRIISLTAVFSALLLVISCGGGGGSGGDTTAPDSANFTVTYNGNGSTGGGVPVDASDYKQGQSVTVLANTGNLVRTGYTFSGWKSGSGTAYSPGQTFTMGNSDVTLYVIWNAILPSSNLIIDHSCTKLALIPEEWISQAKADLHIGYNHTSHGGQITHGMTGLAAWKGDTYAYNTGGTGGVLDLRDYAFSGADDLGNPNRTAWADATRTYLKAHSELNVVMWAWCGQVSSSTEADINTYLNLMSQLEAEFPDVKFVYMTGHTDGTGLTGNLYLRNKQIRDYCIANSKILYDFADIESYDPDGVYYGDRHVTDACNYDYDNDGTTSQSGDPALPGGSDRNWAIDWQNSHTVNVDWYNKPVEHSQPLNGNLKAYAAWWLFARLAGWDGE